MKNNSILFRLYYVFVYIFYKLRINKVINTYKKIIKYITGRTNLSSDNLHIYISTKRLNQLLKGEYSADKLLTTISNTQQETIFNKICSLSRKRKDGQLCDYAQTEEISFFVANNMQYMTTDFLDALEQIAMASGLFNLSYAIRKKNEELILAQANENGISAKRTATKFFWSCLNNNKKDELFEYINSTDNDFVVNHINTLCSYIGILPRDNIYAGNNPKHNKYAQYIAGKRIAVIGPISSNINHTEEIKQNFDIIIRLGYRGINSIPQSQHDLLPNISYFKGAFIESVFSSTSNDIAFLSDLDFVVLKKYDELKRLQALKYTDTRYAIRPHNGYFFFMGGSTFLQLVLQDLSHFNPSYIKVFDATLWLSNTYHNKEYAIKEHNLNSFEHWRSFAIHNLIDQYDYTKHLYRNNMIGADEVLSEILKLDTAEYMARLETQENMKHS